MKIRACPSVESCCCFCLWFETSSSKAEKMDPRLVCVFHWLLFRKETHQAKRPVSLAQSHQIYHLLFSCEGKQKHIRQWQAELWRPCLFTEEAVDEFSVKKLITVQLVIWGRQEHNKHGSMALCVKWLILFFLDSGLLDAVKAVKPIIFPLPAPYPQPWLLDQSCLKVHLLYQTAAQPASQPAGQNVQPAKM